MFDISNMGYVNTSSQRTKFFSVIKRNIEISSYSLDTAHNVKMFFCSCHHNIYQMTSGCICDELLNRDNNTFRFVCVCITRLTSCSSLLLCNTLRRGLKIKRKCAQNQRKKRIMTRGKGIMYRLINGLLLVRET